MKSLLHCILSFVFVCGLATAADAPQGDAKAEMMKKWQEYATPGAPHKVLAGMAGNWKFTSTWWETANSKPEKSTGTSHMKMILGGRWLQHTTKSKAMGMPFEGLGLTGYDNIKGKYETLWLDSMGTGVMHGTGTFDESTKTLTDTGEGTCPMTPGGKRAFRGEWKITDKNNMTYTMYMPDTDGKEFKTGELVFKRN